MNKIKQPQNKQNNNKYKIHDHTVQNEQKNTIPASTGADSIRMSSNITSRQFGTILLILGLGFALQHHFKFTIRRSHFKLNYMVNCTFLSSNSCGSELLPSD
jgi:hypothetical protein